MNTFSKRIAISAAVAAVLASSAWWVGAQNVSAPDAAGPAAAPRHGPIVTVPGMPPVIDPNNLYSENNSSHMSPNVAGALERVYVPNHTGNTVSVIDPNTMKVVDTYKVGVNPQHVVPSWTCARCGWPITPRAAPTAA